MSFVSLCAGRTSLDLCVQRNFFRVVFIVVVGIHAKIMEGKFLLYPLLERLALLQSQAVALGDDWDDVDNIAKLLQDNDVDRLEGVAGRLDEEEAAVNAGILDVALTLRRELLVEICAVLILDVLDNRVPAAVVIDEVAVARGIHNVESQAHAVLLDDVRYGLDFSCAADGLIWCDAALGVQEMRGKDGVNEG